MSSFKNFVDDADMVGVKQSNRLIGGLIWSNGILRRISWEGYIYGKLVPQTDAIIGRPEVGHNEQLWIVIKVINLDKLVRDEYDSVMIPLREITQGETEVSFQKTGARFWPKDQLPPEAQIEMDTGIF